MELAEKLEHAGHRPSGHSTDALAAGVREAFLSGREATIRVESALSGLGITPSETVTRTRALLDRLAHNDDVDVVTTAHDAWADLVAGESAVTRLDALLQTHLDDLRIARREARQSPQELPEMLLADHAELRDLLTAGDLADHSGRIIAIAHRLADARSTATLDVAARLSATLTGLSAGLRAQFGADEVALSEALRPIEALAPPDNLTGVDASALEARIDSAHVRAETAARVSWRSSARPVQLPGSVYPNS